jgi:phage-related baseplate assembly protein
MITATIDLSQLETPTVVEVIDFEVLLAERKAKLVSLYPVDQQAEIAATLELESEPLVMMLQESCYREITLRQRINDAARAVMLAYAKGADLDQLGALLGVSRLTVTPADPDNNVAAVMEADDDLRKRIQMAPETFTVAGSEGAYIAIALAADGNILDAAVKSPSPGSVLVSVLSRDGDGTASAELITAVADAVNAQDVRPLTDSVMVQSAEIVPYQVEAAVVTFPGPDPSVVFTEARARLDAYVEACHRVGREVAISGIHAALHVAGVENVTLIKPTANVVTNDTQAPYCTAISLTYGGANG